MPRKREKKSDLLYACIDGTRYLICEDRRIFKVLNSGLVERCKMKDGEEGVRPVRLYLGDGEVWTTTRESLYQRYYLAAVERVKLGLLKDKKG